MYENFTLITDDYEYQARAYATFLNRNQIATILIAYKDKNDDDRVAVYADESLYLKRLNEDERLKKEELQISTLLDCIKRYEDLTDDMQDYIMELEEDMEEDDDN